MATLEARNFLQKQVELLFKNKNLVNLKFQFTNACKDGENYLGSLYRVKVIGERNGENEELHLIIKCVPEDEQLGHVLRARDIFLNEIAFYEERLPLLNNFLKEFNFQYNDVPGYYGCSKTPKNEFLILEDLKNEGYVLKGTKLLDYPHAVLAAQHLGRFHACSFALRDKRPTELEKFRKIKEPFFFESGCYKENIDLILEAAILSLENEEKHYIERIKRLKKNAQEVIDFACDSRNSEPYAALSHGDLWTCNMLFKYNKNSEPEDVRFLDFQLNRYASPAMDILYTFFTCLTKEMRDKFYDELLHHYHDSLSQMLKKLDCDVEKLFPFDALLDHLQRFGEYGACMSAIDIHLFAAEEGDNAQPIFNIDYLRTLPVQLKNNKFYHDMIRDTMKDMIDKNYL